MVGSVKFGAVSLDVLVFAGGYNGGWNADYTARVGKDLDDSDDPIEVFDALSEARRGRSGVGIGVGIYGVPVEVG